MHSLKSPSALTIATAMMRMVWSGVLSRFGFAMGEQDFDLVIHNWVTGILSQFDELLAQYRAGKLVPVTTQPAVTTLRKKSQYNSDAEASAFRLTVADEPASRNGVWPEDAGCSEGSDHDHIVTGGCARVFNTPVIFARAGGYVALGLRRFAFAGRGVSAGVARFVSNFQKMGLADANFCVVNVPVCD